MPTDEQILCVDHYITDSLGILKLFSRPITQEILCLETIKLITKRRFLLLGPPVESDWNSLDYSPNTVTTLSSWHATRQDSEIARELEGKNRITVRIIAKDLSNQSAPSEIREQLRSESVTVDVLINCAGFGTLGLFSDADLASQLSMIQVNAVAVTHLTHLFLKDMLKRGEGKILNVASTAAFQPGPLMAVYYATKAYVLSFSEAIAEEVRRSGVTVTALCPGPTKTAFQARAKMLQTRLYNSAMLNPLPAETVAKIGYQGLMANKTLIIPGLKNRIIAFVERLLPRQWITKIVRLINEQI
jgi:short-subunit dehydrogenase